MPCVIAEVNDAFVPGVLTRPSRSATLPFIGRAAVPSWQVITHA